MVLVMILPPRTPIPPRIEVDLALVHHTQSAPPADPTELELAQAEMRLRLTEQQAALTARPGRAGGRR